MPPPPVADEGIKTPQNINSIINETAREIDWDIVTCLCLVILIKVFRVLCIVLCSVVLAEFIGNLRYLVSCAAKLQRMKSETNLGVCQNSEGAWSLCLPPCTNDTVSTVMMMMMMMVLRYTGRRFVTERTDAEQRRRHLLHSDRRTRSVNDRLTTRIRLQIQAAGRPQEGASSRVITKKTPAKQSCSARAKRTLFSA